MDITTNPQDYISKVRVGMHAPPLITTIVPTFRRPKLLRRAIVSVLNQTYTRLRVCVYDNASNDETADIVADIVKRDPRVSYYCHSENIGALSNFNYGLRNVRTPLFSFLSDDDILLPECFETALKGFHNHPEAAFSSTDVIVMNSDGTSGGTCNAEWEDGCYFPPSGLLAMFENGHHRPTWTGTLFRTSVIEHIGFLDEEVGGPSDVDYILRIAAHFPFVMSKVLGAIFFSHPASYGCSGGVDLVWPGWKKMIRNLTDDSSLPFWIREEVSQYLTDALRTKVFRYGTRSIKSKQYDDAYRVANILHSHLDANAWALFICSIARCCQRFPCLHSALAYCNGVRRRLINCRGRNQPFPQVEKYRHYLEEV